VAKRTKVANMTKSGKNDKKWQKVANMTKSGKNDKSWQKRQKVAKMTKSGKKWQKLPGMSMSKRCIFRYFANSLPSGDQTVDVL
jgi:hypothetical protein